MKIGLIGTGTIGKLLLEKINSERIFTNHYITSVLDEREKSKETLSKLSKAYHFSAFHDVHSFLKSGIDFIVECANIAAVQTYAATMLREKDMLIISVGALMDEQRLDELTAIAKTNQTKLYLPSGAIGGLETIQAAHMLGGLHTVTLNTRKPAHALTKKPVTKATTIFAGPAKDAIKKYPQNANVAITLSLAGLGVNETQVKIIADPNIDKNIHTIHASGEFGMLDFTLTNNPLPTNPKTSYLTALSILSAIKSLDQCVIIG
ncbi:MAG TPA: aspartate dehydrogenase [Bacillota bacterium]